MAGIWSYATLGSATFDCETRCPETSVSLARRILEDVRCWCPTFAQEHKVSAPRQSTCPATNAALCSGFPLEVDRRLNHIIRFNEQQGTFILLVRTLAEALTEGSLVMENFLDQSLCTIYVCPKSVHAPTPHQIHLSLFRSAEVCKFLSCLRFCQLLRLPYKIAMGSRSGM